MRIFHFVFAGAFAAAAMLTAPVLAKNSDSRNGEEKATSSSCSAYQQAPDGTWQQLPCKESGERGQVQTLRRTSAQGSNREER
jgi:hypothetical protein